MDGVRSHRSCCCRGTTIALWTALALTAGVSETAQAQFLGQNFVTGNASGATAVLGSQADGANATASGNLSLAIGNVSLAAGRQATAVGSGAQALADTSTALGSNAIGGGIDS